MNTPEHEQHNPYASPAADSPFAAPAPSTTAPASFYAMSPTKLWVMSVLTFGLYNAVFFYRHWRFLRDEHGHPVSPFWRAVFGPFMYFPLNQQVRDAARFANVSVSGLLAGAPFLYFALYAGERLLDSAFESSSLASDLILYALVPLTSIPLILTQGAVNTILEHEGRTGPVNRGVTVGAIIAGSLGALLWASALFGTFVDA